MTKYFHQNFNKCNVFYLEMKKKSINQWQPYLCIPKSRCENIEDLLVFEDESLLDKLRPKNYVPKSKKNEENDEESESEIKDNVESEVKDSEKDSGNKREEDEVDKPGLNRQENSSNLKEDQVIPPNDDLNTPNEIKESVDKKDVSVVDSKQTVVEADIIKNNNETKLVKSVTSLGFCKSHKERPKNGLFNSVESIGRLLRSNPVKLSYTRSNFSLKQAEQSWEHPGDYENNNNNSLGNYEEGKSTSTNVVSKDLDPNFNKSAINRVLHPNDYRTFGAFERSHTISNNNHRLRVNMALQDCKPHNHSLNVENKSPKFKPQRPTMVLNRIHLQEAPDSEPASHQVEISASLASRIKDAIPIKESETVNNPSEKMISQCQRSWTPNLNSGLPSKGVANLFAIGDIIPVMNKSIDSRNIRTENSSSNIRKTNSDNKYVRVVGKDGLLSYEDELMTDKDGVLLHQLKERNQNVC